MQNYYDILGLSRTATHDDIRRAYRKAALKYHPDKGGDPNIFSNVQIAFEILGDQKKRQDYDAGLRRSGSRDGMNPPSQSQESKKTGGASARKKKQTTEPPRAASNVEIPSNPESLSVRELKSLLTQLNINHQDCIEKSDLVRKLREFRNVPRRNTTQQRRQASDSLAIKILSIGDPECGKSCIIKRYCEGRFVSRYISTIGVDYGVKTMNIQSKNVAVNFFDLSGQRDYFEIRREFYSDSQGVILVFELNDKATFSNLAKWEREAQTNGLDLNNTQVIVCGNKADLGGKEVSNSEIKKYTDAKGYRYFETSAQSGKGINEALDYLFGAVVSQILTRKQTLLRGLG